MEKCFSMKMAEEWFSEHPDTPVICVGIDSNEQECVDIYDAKKFFAGKDGAFCRCCGQLRSFPTEPGIWEFDTDPLTRMSRWIRVRVERHPEGMTITPVETGEPIWWPNNARWRKVSD